ncbi:hypothetical protein [Kitasatospora griseola]|uniref:hypothetical protein n=1 Tax=Kitasatospora griseola TaxID=2064 RepID=UPI0038013554
MREARLFVVGREPLDLRNIEVDFDDTWWIGQNGAEHRGVKGSKVDGGVAVRQGDSGGLVFANTGLTGQARGLVSGIGSGGSNEILWTEVTDIYNAFGLRLAPPY